MISFKQFITETTDFKIDNPGGQWLKNKQKNADEDYKRTKGLNGSTTGFFRKVELPVDHIRDFKGANDEHYTRESLKSIKSQQLERDVGSTDKFNSKEHPILIGVNHRGEPHVMEGNHRLGYAVRNKISHIHAEVKYYNGGEEVDGPLHPDKVKSIMKQPK